MKTRRRRRSGTASGPINPFTNLLIHDTFTAADSTNMNARTPSPVTNGNNWAVIKGAFNILGNRANNPNASDCLVQVDPATTDYAVECDLITNATIDSTWFGGIIVRGQNGQPTTGTIVYFDRSIGANGSWRIGGGGENVSPVYDTAAMTLAPSTSYHLVIVCIADVVTLYVDGVLKCTAIGTDTANQRISLVEFHPTNAGKHDNFQVFT